MTRDELNALLTECYDNHRDIQRNGDEVFVLHSIAAWAHMDEPGMEESDRDWMCEQLTSLARVLQDAAQIIEADPWEIDLRTAWQAGSPRSNWTRDRGEAPATSRSAASGLNRRAAQAGAGL
jgi:hypothetical protein